MSKQITIERTYPHPVEKVWQAISTAEALSEWLMPNDLTLERGKEFTFQTKPQPGFDGKVKCKLLDFKEPEFISYTWQGGPLKKPTTVTFKLTSTNSGTQLHFTHSGLEGLINQYIVRFILGRGWKDLLGNKILKYLT